MSADNGDDSLVIIIPFSFLLCLSPTLQHAPSLSLSLSYTFSDSTRVRRRAPPTCVSRFAADVYVDRVHFCNIARINSCYLELVSNALIKCLVFLIKN